MVNRFQRIVAFDRAMALASTALTAMIALAILLGPLLGYVGQQDTASRIVARYGLTGGGADAVQQIFSADEQTSTNLLGVPFLLISVLSFTRAGQRFFEQTWELKPLGVRNTANGLLWIAALAVYLTGATWIRAVTGRSGSLDATSAWLTAPLSCAFLLLTGLLLTNRRLSWRDLLPFAVAAAMAEAAYSMGATAYLPVYFSTSASRYGPVGAVFAMISTLFVVMLITVGAGALGREVVIELERIRRGEETPDGEVRQEWSNLRAEARLRWDVTRERIQRRESHPPREPG
ncbi:hypothetical protein [Streptacidiphilus sp. MAP12-20]|uniref:hypothetical protein n=1 Tax=Streptacidiphilus sp. MAP12-20 TaxID=3156299 RepID=UPI003515EF7C